MKLVGIMPARNEEWVIGMTTRAALMWMDELVVLNHCSTDRTREILLQVSEEHPGRLIMIDDGNPVWFEMAHRQRLLETARGRGATHIALVDADEILTGNLLSDVRQIIEKTPGKEVAQLAWLCMWRSLDQVCTVSRHWATPWVSFGFRDNPAFHWAQRDGYDFHHRHPMGSVYAEYRPVPRAAGGLMHLQFVQWRRLLAKQALYKMTEVIRWPGRETVQRINEKYDAATNESGLEYKPAPEAWWAAYSHLRQYANVDQEPWQAQTCRDLVAQYGSEKFKGLNLYGVC